MNKNLLSIVVLSLLSACSDVPSQQDKSAAPVVKAVGEGASAWTVMTIEGVDAAKRKVTLRSSQGLVGTYSVSPEVKRLEEIKAGDKLEVDYRVSAIAELREPTEEEAKAPLVLAEMVDRRPANQSPGGTIMRSLRSVVSIEAVNNTAATITLKGPLEGQLYLKVQEASIMPQLKVGQKIVVTFEETMIVAVHRLPEKH